MGNNKLIKGEALSPQKFKKPSREFGIMPFWFWNGKMSYEEMEYQLKEFYDKGIPGIFIHARFGIKDGTGYLTDDWFERVKFTVEKAQEIGLQVWVYDEYNWPSGTAGQQVMKEDPDLTQRYLELIVQDINGKYFTFLEGTDSRYVDMEQSEPIYACAISEEDFNNGNPDFIDLMPLLSFDKVITWEAPEGKWKLFYFIERKASWYIDTLDEDSTKKFLELTHERYKKAMGGSFEGKIGGFYTDEPAMHYFEVGKDNYIIPWSKKMFKIFKEYNGYDLKPHLPKLFYNIGPDTHKVRYDFWSTLTKQYEKAYYMQIANWCKENNVAFTGHLLFEEWLRMHARSGGNLFHYLRHFDVVGVDHLYPRVGTREMPEEHVALKIGSSAAHQFGSTRLLCESFGGIYWDVTMERMKWIADWEYVLGVNLLNPHGFHYSIEGERKRDWPPSQFYHHTWWKYYGLFNDYISRLSYILSGGKHVAPVAILYPMSSMWANYTPQGRDHASAAIEFDFVYLTDTLLRLHVDYDYIDEDTLKDVSVKDGKLCINGEEYSLLILPPVTHLKASTLEKIEEFYKAGGKLLADTLLPYECIEGKIDDFAARVNAIFGIDPLKVKRDFEAKEYGDYSLFESENEEGGKAIFIQGPGLYVRKPKELLKKVILGCVAPEIEIDDEEVFYLHRVKDGKDFYFIINPTEASRDITVAIAGEGVPEAWDIENGDISDINVYRYQDGKTVFSLSLSSYGSALISIDYGRTAGMRIEETPLAILEKNDEAVYGYGRDVQPRIVINKNGEKKEIIVPAKEQLEAIKFNDEWSFSTDNPNVLIIDSWKTSIDEQDKGLELGYHGEAFNDADWMDFRMGAWEMQLPFERSEKTYPVTLWHRAKFQAAFIPEDAKLIIDGFKCSEYDIYINGMKLEVPAERSYLDAEMKAVAISKYMKQGLNTVAIRMVVNGKSDGLLDLIKICGTFALLESEGGYFIAPPAHAVRIGDWTKQGYPFFSGTGTYSQKVYIDGKYLEDKILKLALSCGSDIASVTINGQHVGVRMWKPYELDITQYVRPGENEFVIAITNTLINVLESVKKPSGLFGAEIIPYNVYKFNV